MITERFFVIVMKNKEWPTNSPSYKYLPIIIPPPILSHYLTLTSTHSNPIVPSRHPYYQLLKKKKNLKEMSSEKIENAFQPNNTQQSSNMVNNCNEQKSLGTSVNLSKASTRSRRTAAKADNPPPTLKRENAFCEVKKGNPDKALPSALPKVMPESKAHRRTTERAYQAPPALNRENAFREDIKDDLDNALANSPSKAMEGQKAFRRPAERATHFPPALIRENAFCENKKGNFDNTLTSTLSRLMEGDQKHTEDQPQEKTVAPQPLTGRMLLCRNKQDTKKSTSTRRKI